MFPRFFCSVFNNDDFEIPYNRAILSNLIRTDTDNTNNGEENKEKKDYPSTITFPSNVPLTPLSEMLSVYVDDCKHNVITKCLSMIHLT